ncbi:MAG: GAF domain-containing protein [Phycisphaerales bacterium]
MPEPRRTESTITQPEPTYAVVGDVSSATRLVLAHDPVGDLSSVALWLLTGLTATLIVVVIRMLPARRAAAERGAGRGGAGVAALAGEIASAVIRTNGDVVNVSPRLAAILDTDAAALAAPGGFEARLHSDDHATWAQATEARRAVDGVRSEFQVRLRTAQGWRWFHVVQRPPAPGTAPEHVLTFDDITERRAADDRANRLAEVVRTATSIHASLAPQHAAGPALRVAIESVARTLGTERASFCAVDATANRAWFEFEWIDPRATEVSSVLAQRQLVPPHAVAWWLDAFGNGRAAVVERTQSTLADPARAARLPPDAQAMLVVPVVASGQVRGAITFERIRDPRSFRAEEIALTEFLAFAAARSIEAGDDRARRARLDAMEERLAHNELLAQLARGVGPDLHDLLFALTGSIAPSVPAAASGDGTAPAQDRTRLGVNALREIVLALAEAARSDVEERRELDLRRETEIAAQLATRLLPASFRIEVVPASPGVVVANSTPSAIRRMLMSVLSAARASAGRDGHVRIRVGAERSADGSQHAILRVEDSGPSPPPPARPSLLDVLSARDAAAPDIFDAIARRVALSVGATVEFSGRSELGGRTVTIRLPASEVELTGASDASPAPDRLPDVGRVLIIDADEGVRAVLAKAFAALDIEVDARPDARDADRAVLEGPLQYDLAVLDLDLPQGEAHRFLARLREGRSLLPVLALTDGRSDVHASFAPLRMLRKPAGIEALLRESRAVIDDARAWRH